ncbi:MAG: 30S ribosome-binding factor RbfA [Oscillospiraceae bacterium]|nr:30S ribosome-binding factor RbfA [Oscillospiraceae bacterium]
MASNRIGRINEEVQRELSALLRTVKDPRLRETMISITAVETTPDLRYAKVYVSCLDKSRSKDVMRGLRSAAGYLRRELGQSLRLRYTPELQFTEDNSIDQGAHILEIIESLDIPEDAPDDGTTEETEE